MKIGKIKAGKIVVIAILFVSAMLSASRVFAQTASAILRGQVTDPSGAIVTKADVALTPASGPPLSTQTDGQGNYEFKNLAPGEYTLDIVAPGFTLYENTKVEVGTAAQRLNVSLAIEVQSQKVQVSDTAPTVDVNPASNAGAITITSKELEALPDDPDELLTDLQALAGPSAGPNGGQMYIDGFTAGQLPPKSSIREIRINQNPFSAEYDQLGYGRIEIFTKPGTDKLHGQFLVNGNDSAFNSSDPFAGPEPGYDSVQYNGNIGGALNKNASFFFNVDRRNINDLSAIDAQVLDQNLNPVPELESVNYPHQRTNIGPRLDYALGKNNTLTARYQYWRDTETNDGIGQTTLPSQAYDEKTIEQTFQIGDTQVYGSKVVNETRFQYLRDETSMNSLNLTPQTSVLGAFIGGGNGTVSSDHQNHYEFQNYTSVIHGNHTLKFGVRARPVRESNTSTAGFNGTFTFSSLTEFQAAECALQGSLPSACASLPAGTPDTPRQLSITTGSPYAELVTYDVEPYIQDDWRVRPNITLSYGMRFETQNDIHDHADLAPRLGFAWGVHGRSGPPIVVIRGGSGVFYTRFQAAQILQAQRLNGITQQQSVIDNPTCYPGLGVALTVPISSCGTPASTTSTIYQINPSLTAPYTLQSALSVERQVTKSATLSLTYLNSRGFDQLVTINASAPAPGTPCFPNCPIPASQIYQFVSGAAFKQNQLIVNSNIRVGQKLQLFTYYTLNYANSDTGGVNSFASNSYDISQDYGRASFDVRQRLFLGGSIGLKYGFRFSPFFVASSGSPFSVTTANDLNGDSIFNDRPGFVSSATCPTTVAPAAGSTIWCTPLGTFNDVPSATAKLAPINFATGPSHVSLNFRLAKTWGLGPKINGKPGAGGGPGGPGGGGGRGGGPRGPLFGGGGPISLSSASDRRYNLTLSTSLRNAFNKLNLANPGGVLESPFFDKYNGLFGGPFSTGVANRRIDVQASFSF